MPALHGRMNAWPLHVQDHADADGDAERADDEQPAEEAVPEADERLGRVGLVGAAAAHALLGHLAEPLQVVVGQRGPRVEREREQQPDHEACAEVEVTHGSISIVFRYRKYST